MNILIYLQMKSNAMNKFSNPSGDDSKKQYIKYILFLSILALLIFTAYSPVSKNTFLNWDDGAYVKDNADIQHLKSENLTMFFTKSYVGTYLPLTMISYAINYQTGGLNPQIYVYTNVLLHFCNSAFVFFLLISIFSFFDKINNSQITRSKFFLIPVMTSVLFAIHPVNVESVAWVAERKNVLFTFFFLLSLMGYIKYLAKPGWITYLVSLCLFLLSLLSKGVAVSLPLCLIAIDYLQKRKLLSKKAIIEKIPFFILSLSFGIVAILAQGKEYVEMHRPFYEQCAMASFGFINYLVNLILPVNLIAMYPYPKEISFIHYISLAATVTFLVCILILWKRTPAIVLFGILFFILNILLLLQMIPVGNAVLADRYVYLPSIGFFLVAVFYITKLPVKPILVLVIFFILAVSYSFGTHERVKIWSNNYSLWDDVIRKNKNVAVAWNNRGMVRRDSGNITGAFIDFSEAIKVNQGYKEPYNNRGILNFQMGNAQAAMADFSKAIEVDTTFATAYYNRGKLRKLNKDYEGALSDLNKSIHYDKQNINAYILSAKVLTRLNRYVEAINDCDSVLIYDKNSLNAYIIKSGVLIKKGEYQKATEVADNGLNLDPKRGILYYIKGISYQRAGNKAASDDNLARAKDLGFDPGKDGMAADLEIDKK
jgi:protein O-mannosyl-transferase